MGYMLFDDRETYVTTITDLMNRCDICELDKILNFMIKRLWPWAK